MSNEEFVAGIEYPRPFNKYVLSLCESASRYICLLSPQLDHSVFDSADLVDALSALARRSRQTQVRILISDSQTIVGRGHKLLLLAQRLPSTVRIQTLSEHPDWRGSTVVVRDTSGVLYKPAGSGNDAFYEPDSRASTRCHLELFEELWRCSVENPELRPLSI